MAIDLSNISPLWISVLANIVLVGVTIFYAWQTKKTVDVAKMSIIYQRKPLFITKIESLNNILKCLIKNDEKSSSSVKNIEIKLSMKLGDETYNIGKYKIEGYLLPGEEDSPSINSKIIKKLKELDLMTSHTVQFPEEDKYGRYYMAEFGVFDIKKKKITYDIVIKTKFEVDVENMEKNEFINERIFEINLYMDDGPPDEYQDNFSTRIEMKSGNWVN